MTTGFRPPTTWLGPILCAVALTASLAGGSAAQTPIRRPASGATMAPLPPPPPTGLPPVNLRIVTSGPGQQNVMWDVSQPFLSFILERQDPGITNWKLITPQPVTVKGAPDVSFVPPGAVYRVTANYADGTVGTAQVTHLNPVPPTHPSNFRATQTAEGTVDLTWDPVSGATGYQLFGPGQPAGGTLVRAQSFRVTGIQPGAYQFNIASIFAPGMWTAPAPATVATVRRLTANYRISINGFTVLHESRDDPFDRDGKADEVYAAAITFLYDGLTATRPTGGPRQAWTAAYGDIRGYPDRIPAGSGSPTGGLRTGDVVPAGNPAAPTTAVPTSGRFPLLVWDGSLTSKQQFLVISPALWESDRDLSAFNFWNSIWTDVLVKGVGLSPEARSAIRATTIERIFPAVRDVTGAPLSTEAKDGRDRPIGASDGRTGPVFFMTAVVLTQDLIEAALAGAGGTRVVVPIQYRDVPHHGDGNYVLYLQIERLP